MKCAVNYNRKMMRIHLWENLIFLTLVLINSSDGQNIKQCPEYQIHFEKILGFRPVPLALGYGANSDEIILFKAYHQIPSVINLQCMEMCRNDFSCESYALNFNKSECYGYTSNERRLQTYNLRRLDDLGLANLVEDISVVYFVKTCLNIPLTCKDTLWPLLRIPGSSLIGRGYLTLNKLVTRRECIERCLFEKAFKCASVSFQTSQRNNMVRMFTNILNRDIMGRCILSRDDKNTEPDSFRVAQINDEYIENQCQVVNNGADEKFLDDLCAYEHYPESALIYAEHEFVGLTDRECQEKCFKEKYFFCKGLTYRKMNGLDNSRCYIHSEDVISMGPRAVVSMRNSYYMKRVQCLNLNVRCTQNEMIIRYHPRQFFQGRIYTENHQDQCGVAGSNYGPTFLTLPIGSPLKEQRCGINRAFDYETQNRTLVFTYIIIQNNPLVMMQSDRYIKVGCIIRSDRTSDSGVPDFVSLETSMEFGGKDYDGSGSLVIDDGGDIPKLNVIILDPFEDMPIKEARIGQILKLVISMESHHDNYDLKAVNLTATSEHDRLELIGPTGCPKNPAIFPALQHETTSTSRQLVTKFKAFKFASSSQLKFSVSIQFCYKACKPINCGYGIVSHGRKKRQAESAKIVNSGIGPVKFPDQIGPVVFPDQIGPVVFPEEIVQSSTSGSMIFPDFDPNEATTTGPMNFPDYHSNEANTLDPMFPEDDSVSDEAVTLGPITSPGPVMTKLTAPSQNLPGVRIDSFGNPQGIQQYLGGIKDEENEVPDEMSSKYREKVVTVPLDISLKVIEPEVNGTDRLVIADSELYVASFASASSLCLDQSLLTAILIFWIIFQILILLGCCIMVRRYRKFRSQEDDRSSLENSGYYPDSLENRHVRWADQRSYSQSQDAYYH